MHVVDDSTPISLRQRTVILADEHGSSASKLADCSLVKFADYTLLHLYLAPPLGVTPFEFRKDFWHKKTRVPGVSCGVVCVILSVAILIEYRLVTDRRMDGQTHDNS